MKDLQSTATRIFIAASIVFGIIGVVMILSMPEKGDPPQLIIKLLFSTGFIVLSSFGVSVGLKYLSGK